MALIEQREEFLLPALAVEVAQVVHVGNGMAERRDALFLRMAERAGPVAYLFQRAFQASPFAIVRAAAKFVLARKLLVDLVELLFKGTDVIGRQRRQHFCGVLGAVLRKRAKPRFYALDHPRGIVARERTLPALPDFGEKARVVRQLLLAVPLQQSVDANIEVLLLPRVEIKVIGGSPCQDTVGLVVAHTQRAA